MRRIRRALGWPAGRDGLFACLPPVRAGATRGRAAPSSPRAAPCPLRGKLHRRSQTGGNVAEPGRAPDDFSRVFRDAVCVWDGMLLVVAYTRRSVFAAIRQTLVQELNGAVSVSRLWRGFSAKLMRNFNSLKVAQTKKILH